MKRFLFFLTFVFFLLPFTVNAKASQINIYLFYGKECPHCAALEKYLDKEYKNDEDIKIYRYEVWHDNDNKKLWEKVESVTGKKAKGVPYFIIGDILLQGYNDTPSWEETVDDAINSAKENGYTDDVGVALGITKESNKDKTVDSNKEKEKKEEKEIKTTKIDLPILGTIELKNVALPLATIIIGLVDGFNPCAMWVLIFLITMLLDYKDKKKMWILGCAFLFTSAFIYFLFLLGIQAINTLLNKKNIFIIIASIFALTFGTYNVYRYFKTRKTAGCDVVDKNQRRKIMIRIKNALANKNILLSLIGIIFISITVNLIELGCTAGLPYIFSTLLEINNVEKSTSIIYMVIYILFFLLDDLIVFFIAMKTLKITAISNKYTKYSHLIGGVIMFIIGLTLVFKPEWLMLNFK